MSISASAKEFKPPAGLQPVGPMFALNATPFRPIDKASPKTKPLLQNPYSDDTIPHSRKGNVYSVKELYDSFDLYPSFPVPSSVPSIFQPDTPDSLVTNPIEIPPSQSHYNKGSRGKNHARFGKGHGNQQSSSQPGQLRHRGTSASINKRTSKNKSGATDRQLDQINQQRLARYAQIGAELGLTPVVPPSTKTPHKRQASKISHGPAPTLIDNGIRWIPPSLQKSAKAIKTQHSNMIPSSSSCHDPDVLYHENLCAQLVCELNKLSRTNYNTIAITVRKIFSQITTLHGLDLLSNALFTKAIEDSVFAHIYAQLIQYLHFTPAELRQRNLQRKNATNKKGGLHNFFQRIQQQKANTATNNNIDTTPELPVFDTHGTIIHDPWTHRPCDAPQRPEIKYSFLLIILKHAYYKLGSERSKKNKDNNNQPVFFSADATKGKDKRKHVIHGAVLLLGQMFRRGLVPYQVILICLGMLLEERNGVSEADLELACLLLSSVGKALDVIVQQLDHVDTIRRQSKLNDSTNAIHAIEKQNEEYENNTLILSHNHHTYDHHHDSSIAIVPLSLHKQYSPQYSNSTTNNTNNSNTLHADTFTCNNINTNVQIQNNDNIISSSLTATTTAVTSLSKTSAHKYQTSPILSSDQHQYSPPAVPLDVTLYDQSLSPVFVSLPVPSAHSTSYLGLLNSDYLQPLLQAFDAKMSSTHTHSSLFVGSPEIASTPLNNNGTTPFPVLPPLTSVDLEGFTLNTISLSPSSSSTVASCHITTTTTTNVHSTGLSQPSLPPLSTPISDNKHIQSRYLSYDNCSPSVTLPNLTTPSLLIGKNNLSHSAHPQPSSSSLLALSSPLYPLSELDGKHTDNDVTIIQPGREHDNNISGPVLFPSLDLPPDHPLQTKEHDPLVLQPIGSPFLAPINMHHTPSITTLQHLLPGSVPELVDTIQNVYTKIERLGHPNSGVSARSRFLAQDLITLRSNGWETSQNSANKSQKKSKPAIIVPSQQQQQQPHTEHTINHVHTITSKSDNNNTNNTATTRSTPITGTTTVTATTAKLLPFNLHSTPHQTISASVLTIIDNNDHNDDDTIHHNDNDNTITNTIASRPSCNDNIQSDCFKLFLQGSMTDTLCPLFTSLLSPHAGISSIRADILRYDVKPDLLTNLSDIFTGNPFLLIGHPHLCRQSHCDPTQCYLALFKSFSLLSILQSPTRDIDLPRSPALLWWKLQLQWLYTTIILSIIPAAGPPMKRSSLLSSFQDFVDILSSHDLYMQLVQIGYESAMDPNVQNEGDYILQYTDILSSLLLFTEHDIHAIWSHVLGSLDEIYEDAPWAYTVSHQLFDIMCKSSSHNVYNTHDIYQSLYKHISPSLSLSSHHLVNDISNVIQYIMQSLYTISNTDIVTDQCSLYIHFNAIISLHIGSIPQSQYIHYYGHNYPSYQHIIPGLHMALDKSHHIIHYTISHFDDYCQRISQSIEQFIMPHLDTSNNLPE